MPRVLGWSRKYHGDAEIKGSVEWINTSPKSILDVRKLDAQKDDR